MLQAVRRDTKFALIAVVGLYGLLASAAADVSGV